MVKLGILLEVTNTYEKLFFFDNVAKMSFFYAGHAFVHRRGFLRREDFVKPHT